MPNTPAFAFDGDTLVAEYPSVQAAAQAQGVATSSVSRAISGGGLCAGLRWAATRTAPPVKPRKARARKPRPERQGVRAQPVTGVTAAGQPVTYASQQAAAQALGVSQPAVSVAIRQGRAIAGVTLSGQRAPRYPKGTVLVAYDDHGREVARATSQIRLGTLIGVSGAAIGVALNTPGRRAGGCRILPESAPAPDPLPHTR